VQLGVQRSDLSNETVWCVARYLQPVRRVIIGRAMPLMFSGGLSTSSVRIVLPLEKTEALRINRLVVRPGDLAILAPGSGYDVAGRDDAKWASVVLSGETLHTLLKEPHHTPLHRPGAYVVLRASPKVWTEAVPLITAATEVALQDPQVLTVAEALRELLATAKQNMLRGRKL
jgi:hypothetical protein